MLARRQSAYLALGLGLLVGALFVLSWRTPEPALTRKRVLEGDAKSDHLAAPIPAATLGSKAVLRKDPNISMVLPAATAAVRFERDAQEWQGMLPPSKEVWPCPEYASGCGMGRACVEGVCTPCFADGECLDGELCVLGVCALVDAVGCRSAMDCADGEVCMMSGFTPLDERNNADLSSKCVRHSWDEGMDEIETRAKDEADLAYQKSTTYKDPTASAIAAAADREVIAALRGAL